jgi:hypothetical protein
MYVQIDAERLRQIVMELAAYHALRAAGVDNWQQYEFVEWPTSNDVDRLYNDVVRNIWHSTPPQAPIAKALLRWANSDSKYDYMLCSWVEDNEGVLCLVDSGYNDDVPFDPGDQWMELEHKVPDNV